MESESYFENSKYVTELTPNDFKDIATWKLKNNGCTAVLFYAPWCPHCKAVKQEWENFGKMATFMDVCALNCEKYKSHLLKIKEDLPKLVVSFPTMIFYKNGSPDEQYIDERIAKKMLKKGMEMCQS